jgi:hypothetical protein
VLENLTEEQKPSIAKKLNVAYALEDYAAAKLELNKLHRELMDLNPSAASSLGGMEETLTCIAFGFRCNFAKRWPARTYRISFRHRGTSLPPMLKCWHDGESAGSVRGSS